jgi:hypothetical protein
MYSHISHEQYVYQKWVELLYLAILYFYLLDATFCCHLHDVQPNTYITIMEYHNCVFLFAQSLNI